MEAFEKELLSDNTKVAADTMDDSDEELEYDVGVEVTFGKGSTKKVLLCTSGVSLKNIVEMSK